MADNDTSDLAQAIQEVSQRASLIVREEIELAKAEMAEKARRMAIGAAAGAIAGIFLLGGLIYLLHSASWLLWQLTGTKTSYWLGFVMVGGGLAILGIFAGLAAVRFLKRAMPPSPKMAIEEGRLIKDTVSSTRPATPVGPGATVPAPTTVEGRR
jgi:putative superfamily III holin-X